jgi:PAS domain S-box-containing protein
LGSWRVEFRPDGDVWTVSEELNRIWGDEPGTQVTMGTGFARVHPDDRIRVAEAWTAAIHTAGPSEWDQRILVDGQERWIAVHARVECDQAGRPFAMAGTNQDITERKRIETELRAAEAKYRLVTENASDVIWLMDAETQRFVYVSPSVMRLRGYAPEEVMAQPAERSLTPESQARVDAVITENLSPFLAGAAAGGPFVTLVDQPTKSGDVVPTEVTTSYVRDEATGKVYIVGVSRDITERKRTEGRLEQLASEQAAVLTTVPAAIWYVVGRQIVWTNPAIEELFGYSAIETIGMDTSAFYVNRTTFDDVRRNGYAVLDRGECYRCEVEMKRRTGESVWCHLAGRYIDAGHPARGAIWVIQDISARKRAEERLQSAAEAQRALLREVNHRVKNNLSALLGIVHLEQDRAVTDGQPAVDRAMHELDARLRSLATVHAMLSLSEWRPVRLDDLCSRVISNVLGASAGHPRHMQIDDSPVVVDANQAHNLALVLSELATNTLKYGTDPKRPTIRVAFEQTDGDVLLTYRDEGPGFPAAVLEGPGSAERVGLQLIRGLVYQSLRGELTLSNDRGAVVAITFPLGVQGEQ